MQRYRAYLCTGLLIAALLMGCSLADNVETRNYFNKAHPGKCTLPDNIILSPLQTGNLKSTCAEVQCLNEQGDAQIEKCDLFRYQIPQDCGGSYPQLKNPTDPFPKCCEPEYDCSVLWFDPNE